MNISKLKIYIRRFNDPAFSKMKDSYKTKVQKYINKCDESVLNKLMKRYQRKLDLKNLEQEFTDIEHNMMTGQ